MKIYFSPTSPFVRKCLVAAEELGLGGRITLLPSNAHPIDRDAGILPTNPLGKVPTFVTEDGQALYDSRVICEYLNERAQGSLFPAAGPSRWATLTRQSLGDGMMDAALLARYEDALRPEPIRWPEWRAAQLDKVSTSLAALENEQTAPRGGSDIGSIAVGCALWYLDLRFRDIGWRQHYPATAQWYAEFGKRESMMRVWSLES
ncbi:MAG: glutathione S-transferase [Burkholderiaceae bacterium]